MAKNATLKQQKLLNLLHDNLSDLENSKTLKQLMLQAGYSEVSAHNPHLTLNTQGVIEGSKRFVEVMEQERDRAIQELPKKIKKASFNHLIYGVDILTKNIQLLSSKATENRAIHIEISEEMARKNTGLNQNQPEM